jgi:hypothetical protein
VDPGIDEQRTALARARGPAAASRGWAEAVDAAGLDVNARDLGSVVRCEDRELDAAAPGVWGEDRADVLVARMPFEKKNEKKKSTTRDAAAGKMRIVRGARVDVRCGRTLE